jgi:site-specific DNA-methyltransferase (adenine-specific)/modification methylase
MTKVEIGNATLYLGDCAEILPTLGHFDAVVTDPPYGIDYDPSQYKGNFKDKIFNDDKEFNPIFLLNISKNIILWGANNYTKNLPKGGWLCWDKRTNEASDGVLGSPFELAWHNNPKKYKIARIQHCGVINADGAGLKRDHPTQKPIRLMEWCIDLLPKNVETIIDPFMGSGTTGIACVNMKKQFVGIEKDQKYFDIDCKRIEDAQRQVTLF